MSLCYFCKIVGNAILCSKYLSERTGQLLFMHKNYVLKCHIILVQESPLEIMSARALLNNECSSPQKDGCSSPQKDGCSRPLKIMGARPHFSREHFMNLFFYESFLYSCVFIHLFPISVLRMMSARALLDNECSSPQKRWVLEPS